MKMLKSCPTNFARHGGAISWEQSCENVIRFASQHHPFFWNKKEKKLTRLVIADDKRTRSLSGERSLDRERRPFRTDI